MENLNFVAPTIIKQSVIMRYTYGVIISAPQNDSDYKISIFMRINQIMSQLGKLTYIIKHQKTIINQISDISEILTLFES